MKAIAGPTQGLSGAFQWGCSGKLSFYNPPNPSGETAFVQADGEPSSAHEADWVRVTRLCTKTRPVTVVRVNVTVPGLDEQYEEVRGRPTCVTTTGPGPLPADDMDLLPVHVTVEPVISGHYVYIGGHEDLYEDRRKEVPASAEYLIEELPPVFYFGRDTPGDRWVSAWHDPSGARDKVKIPILKIDMVPDWNHDRAIDDEDKDQATTSNPFRFWINDDDDDGNEASGDSDIPGQSGGNCADSEVNGRCDLPDFFPVWLDLHDTLNLLPPSGTVQYKLKQANGAVRAVYTDLTKGTAGAFLTTAGSTYGPSFNQNSYEADTFAISSSGVTLSTDFLDKIKNDMTKGVLLVEGKSTSTAPLVLEIWKDGAKICEKEMPLRIDGVEKMYRWINLRHVTGGNETRATDTNEPANYPDSLSNGKHFVFVHGYNNDEQAARAVFAEVFKRLYQSGSRAMFTGLTWLGDETPGILPAGAYYHADVINAFQTASAVASSVTSLPGQKYLAAHSLGNMVASSAIVDHGLNPARYFMLDAAVAMEAYKASERQPGDIAISPWPDYTNRVWASEWYSLFDVSDGRNHLTWRGRFGNIPQAINYHSSGEDVLNNNEAGGSVSLFDAPNRVWVFQEQVKGGILPAILIGVDSHGGWCFNSEYSTGVYDPSNDVYVTATTPAEAALLPEYMLRARSFFKLFYDDHIYRAGGSALAADTDVRGKILAEAMPATSRATGRNEVDGFFSENVDMMTLKTGWPRSNGNWRHTDFKNVAFPYVHQLFEDMVAEGGLQ